MDYTDDILNALSPEEYDALISEMEERIKLDPTKAMQEFTSPEVLARYLRPDNAANRRIFALLSQPNYKMLGISPAQLQKALSEKAKATKAAAAVKQHREAVKAAISDMPTDEVEYAALFWKASGFRMTYDRKFYGPDGHRIPITSIINAAHLLASTLKLVKPRGNVLGPRNIDRALEQKVLAERQARLDVMRALIMRPMNPDAVCAIQQHFHWLCGFMFEEQDFAFCTVLEAIWQVKRMMEGKEVKQKHLFLLVGPQNSGKTEFVRMLIKCIDEIAPECTLADALDTRQMDLLEMFVLFVDEMLHADRADVNAIKNLVTGCESARRPMRTNISEKIAINCTVIGTSNQPLGKLVYDSTGMRRYVELMVKRREDNPHWTDIEALDWLSLWQSVDVDQASPLMTNFQDELEKKQEDARNADNTELWLKQFDPAANSANSGTRKSSEGNFEEWYASELYQLFSDWEQIYDRAWRGTSLARWGRDMKSLIDRNVVEGWSHLIVGNKVVYRLKRPDSAEKSTVERPNIAAWHPRNPRHAL